MLPPSGFFEELQAHIAQSVFFWRQQPGGKLEEVCSGLNLIFRYKWLVIYQNKDVNTHPLSSSPF